MSRLKGTVRRDLANRVFHLIDNGCCGTGGRVHGCPFFRLNGAHKWVCLLYRLFPCFDPVNMRYKRVCDCFNNKEPPTKAIYLISYGEDGRCKVTATSEDEAIGIFKLTYMDEITAVVKQSIIGYEYLF